MKLTVRQRLTLAVLGITTVALVLLVAGFNVFLRESLSADVNRVLEARAETIAGVVDPASGSLALAESERFDPEESLAWVFLADRTLLTTGDRDLDRVAASLNGSPEGRFGVPEEDVRLYVKPIELEHRRVGTVVAGLSLEPYRETAHSALLASVLMGLVMLAVIAVSTRLVVGRALRPVAAMSREAASWSSTDLDRRFNTGPERDELTRLAATFDRMLDQMAQMVRHERDFTAEMSHELRTPLAALAAEADLALQRERPAGEYRDALEQIAKRSSELAGVLETLLEASRADGRSTRTGTVPVAEAVAAGVATFRARAESGDVRLELEDVPSRLVVPVSAESFGRMLRPLLENALAYSRSRVTVNAGATGDGRIRISVSDDGPGFGPEELEMVFEPGRRGRAARNAGAPSGSGFGLPLVRRLARAAGGEVEIGSPGPGATVILTLPRAAPAPSVTV